MTEFVASNNTVVRSNENGLYVGTADLDSVRVYPNAAQGLREFFQHERDIELGRWRSNADPGFVVYADEEDADTIKVLWEPGGGVGEYHRSWTDEVVDVDGWAIARVVREFFAAHPEPKPWESAKPGEVWRLTAEGKEREYATIMGRATFPHPVDHLYFMPTTDVSAPKLGAKATVISAGRRLYPEVSE
jgi:hypothetical protein